MPKRPSSPVREPANLTLEQIARAIPRIQKRISDLEALNPATFQQRSPPEISAIRLSIEQTLGDIFGTNSIEYRRYLGAATLDGGPISLAGSWGRGEPDTRFRHYYEQSKQRSIAVLKQAIAALEEQAEELRTIHADVNDEPAKKSDNFERTSRRVFLVHGHDDGPREALARFLERLDFEPVILHEQPNKGRSLLTKFHEVAGGDIGFAVVLMTPDDFGAEEGEAANPRARQNVIFELGYLIGVLGPERVAAIISAGVEAPSDFDGVVYISLESDWRTQVARELEAAGFEIDWNKAMRGT